jgi:hypothetical protein
MTATNPPLPADRATPRRPRVRRWAAFRSLGAAGCIPALLLAFAPKCAVCLLAYAGLGAALGLSGPELCGAPPAASGQWVWLMLLPGLLLGWFALRGRRGEAV